jgi:hypothetical protein
VRWVEGGKVEACAEGRDEADEMPVAHKLEIKVCNVEHK